MSIRNRIYWSFFMLVLLFVVNAIASLIVLHNSRKLSENVSTVINPSLQTLEDFKDLLTTSKMYTTNWVFLRSNQDDKDALRRLHKIDYPGLKMKLNLLSAWWDDKYMADSLQVTFSRFENLLTVEKKIMSSLAKFEDYEDASAKLESEMLVDDELLPRTASLLNTLSGIVSHELQIRDQKNNKLEESLIQLRLLITALALTIIILGISLSVYMARIIINPINKIRHIVNDLGKGIIRKANNKITSDEIGEMVRSVNNLSEKLEGTATFAQAIGSRNFDTIFQPLSDEDTLGKALISMRDKLKSSDRELLEINAEIQTIYEASLDAVIIIDEEGKIVKWDRKSEMLFGWNEEEVMGVLLSEVIIPERYRGPHARGMRRFLTTGEGPLLGRTIEVSALKKDNVEFDISLSISQVVIKEKGMFIGFIRDITSRKKAEAKLYKSERDLETNNRELVQKNRELEQFAFVASHDLQEPLQTISGFVELMRQRYLGKLDDKADKYLSFIVQSSDRMKLFVNDLLQYSRIGTQKTNEEVNCTVLLKEVLADLGKTIEETHAFIDADPLPLISGHPSEIRQLFQNLIVNAIKFRKNGSVPRIKISVRKTKGAWEFLFADNGIGIEEQHQERIFIIFQRLHTRSEYQGSGIGLSNCKKIVELHNGRIWVESKIGEGSIFHFTIQENEFSN